MTALKKIGAESPAKVSFNVGWYCPNCKNTHGPHVDTCPKALIDRRTLREKIVRCDNG